MVGFLRAAVQMYAQEKFGADMAETLRWGVVGTMDEPAPLILAWVAHHLRLGAAEVHVFLDRPNPAAQAALAPVKNCFVTLCDTAYWQHSTRKERPLRHTARQKYNSTSVYQSRRLDWLLHCDADEFLDLSRSFTRELAQTEARALRLRNVERVRRGAANDIFAGSFRGVMASAPATDKIYGRWAGFLDAGMAGYHDGKDIVRGGEAFTMGVHFPIEAETGARHSDPYTELRSARLLHFDGLTPLHIALKLLKRATEPKYQEPRKFGAQRERQFRFARTHAGKPKQLLQMIDGVFGLNDAQAAALGASHLELRFDPRPALAALGLEADLTQAAFDAELRQREGALIAETGLTL